jgi:hypothetical protein
MRSWVTEKEVLGKVEHYKKAGLWELEQERIKLWKVRDHLGPTSTHTRMRRTADDVWRVCVWCRSAIGSRSRPTGRRPPWPDSSSTTPTTPGACARSALRSLMRVATRVGSSNVSRGTTNRT